MRGRGDVDPSCEGRGPRQRPPGEEATEPPELGDPGHPGGDSGFAAVTPPAQRCLPIFSPRREILVNVF